VGGSEAEEIRVEGDGREEVSFPSPSQHPSNIVAQ